MSDIIAVLPDHLANQIAAGEVIQRPASVVKELLENAIDAKARHIHLIIKDAGKELIQVIDDGSGMSAVDARMCFERHATSKIRNIDDLFSISTMGFRGEALASMAAVAQVELKTRRASEEVGVRILIDQSVVRAQEPCETPVGTNMAVRNLFFNVPARRHFLKSTTVEMRHIVDEFSRTALAHPELSFRFSNQQQDLFRLEKGKLKQRALALMGNQLDARLVPVDEPTEFVKISGFIGTPETSTKTRNNQYFFVNHRFIRSAYLNHAVSQAYRELINPDEHPLFVLFIDIDPKRIDINVHPTKQEIKFDDERIIYSFVHAAVKHALNKYSIAPSLDFSLNTTIEQLPAISQPFSDQTRQQTQNDFLFQSFTQKGQAHLLHHSQEKQAWKELYAIQQAVPEGGLTEQTKSTEHPALQDDPFQPVYLQIALSHMLVTSRHGCLLIDQHLAHQRVLYERYEHASQQPIPVQRLLIPQTLHFAPSDSLIIEELIPELLTLGYALEPFGQHTFILQGVAADVRSGDEQSSIERILEAWKHESDTLKLDKREKLIRSMSMQNAIPRGKKLSDLEMDTLIQDLFRCEQPQLSPTGKKIFVKLQVADIDQLITRSI